MKKNILKYLKNTHIVITAICSALTVKVKLNPLGYKR